MAKKSGKGSTRSKNAGKIEALRRAQQINELLMRSTIESEALQSSGDDRPVGEQHIFDLLDQDKSEKKLQDRVSKDLDSAESRHRLSRKKASPKAKGTKSGKKH